jgi:hypothetical protein
MKEKNLLNILKDMEKENQRQGKISFVGAYHNEETKEVYSTEGCYMLTSKTLYNPNFANKRVVTSGKLEVLEKSDIDFGQVMPKSFKETYEITIPDNLSKKIGSWISFDLENEQFIIGAKEGLLIMATRLISELSGMTLIMKYNDNKSPVLFSDDSETWSLLAMPSYHDAKSCKKGIKRIFVNETVKQG